MTRTSQARPLSTASLATDTAVTPVGDEFTGTVGLRWDNNGRPVGALTAGMMMRAAVQSCGSAHPLSTATSFLEPARPGPVRLEPRGLRRSAALAVVEVVASQEAGPIARSTVWLADADDRGTDSGDAPHAVAEPAPVVPGPDEVPSFEDRMGTGQGAFAGCVVQRPVVWVEDFAHRTPTPPRGEIWLRFVPVPERRDAVTLATELLVAGDLFPPLIAGVALPDREQQVAGARTLELTGRIRPARDCSADLLAQVVCECVDDRLLTATVRAWSADRVFRGAVSSVYRLPRM